MPGKFLDGSLKKTWNGHLKQAFQGNIPSGHHASTGEKCLLLYCECVNTMNKYKTLWDGLPGWLS